MKNFKLFEKCNRRIARRVTLIAVLLAMCIPQAWAGTYTVVGIAADNPNSYDVKWRAQFKTDGDGQWVEDYSDPKAATGITFEGKPLYVCWWDDWFNGVNNLYLKYVDGATEKTSLQFEGGYGWVNVGDYNHRVYNFDSGDHSKYANKTMKKGTRVYFDATGWSGTTIKLVTGHMAHQKYYTLSRVANTNLYYGTTTAETWSDAIGWGVVSGTTYADGNYDDRINKVSEQSTEYTGWKNWELNNTSSNNVYLCVNKGKAGEEPSMYYHPSFYSAGKMNFNQTVYFVARDNGSYSTMSSGKTPATITMSSYKFVSGTYNAVSAESPTAMSVGGTTYSRSFTAARTATTTLTVSNVIPGYKFDGWYSAVTGGELLERGTTYTYYPTSTNNVYARFTKLYAFIEGKFAIYNSTRSSRAYTNSSGSWVTDATTIPMSYDATNNRFYVHTYSTPAELKEKINTYNDPYFIVKTSSSSSSVNSDGYEFFATSSNDADKQLTAAGYANKKAGTTTSRPGSFTFVGNPGTDDGYVIIYCDGSYIWYELDCSVTYKKNGGAEGADGSVTGTTVDSNSPYISGAEVTTISNGYSNSGYKFKWWNTNYGGTGEDFFPGEKFTISANTDLYAQWEQVASGWAYWNGNDGGSGSPIDVTGNGVTMRLTKNSVDWNTGIQNATVVSKYSGTEKHANVLAMDAANEYLQVHFTDGSPINALQLGTVHNGTSGTKKVVVIYSTTADFSTGEHEEIEVTIPHSNQASKGVTSFSPSTPDKYLYARIYKSVSTAVYSYTGPASGGAGKMRIYSIKAQKGTACGPNGLAYETATVNKTYGDAAFTNTLTNAHSLAVSYSSGDDDVATVNSSNGQVTIKGAGSTTITATWDGSVTYCAGTASYTLNVAKASISPSLSYDETTLTAGNDSSSPTITGNSGNGTVTYASDDTDVATVDENTGVVTAVAAGTATITATIAATDNYLGNTASVDFTINPACSVPGVVSVVPNTGYIGAGSYQYGDELTLTASCADGTDASTTYAWYKGADWSTAKAAGAIQAAKTSAAGGTTYTKSAELSDAGTYWCEASNGSGCETHNSSGTDISVGKAAFTPDLNYESLPIPVGSTRDPVLTDVPDGAGAATYSSNNTSVAEVDSETGVVTAKAAGNATIRVDIAESANYIARYDTKLISVREAVLYTVTFDPNGGTIDESSDPVVMTQATEGAALTMPTPVHATYTFDGWYIADTEIGDEGAYTPTKDVTAYAKWIASCSGGSGATVLFNQTFNSDGAGSVAFTANTARNYSKDGTTLTGIVGSGANLFTQMYCSKQSSSGMGVNNSTGGNSRDYTGKFGIYATGGNMDYHLIRSTNLASSAPTAIKVEFNALVADGGNNTKAMVMVAVGSGFSDETTNSYPSKDNVYAGFGVFHYYNSSTHTVDPCSYMATGQGNRFTTTGTITYNSSVKYTWVVNATGDDLEYDDPSSSTTTLATGKWDLWIGTTKVVSAQDRTTAKDATLAGTTMQNLYIGCNGTRGEFILDDFKVTDLAPSGGSGSCYRVNYHSNGADGGLTFDPLAYDEGDLATVVANGFTFEHETEFIGWNTAVDGSGTMYRAGDKLEIPDDDVDLYAQWMPINRFQATEDWLWNNEDNWSHGVLPSASHKVIIEKPCELRSKYGVDPIAKVKSVVIDKYGENTGRLTIGGPAGLAVEEMIKTKNAEGVLVGTSTTDLNIESSSDHENGALAVKGYTEAGGVDLKATVTPKTKARVYGWSVEGEYIGFYVNQFIGTPMLDAKGSDYYGSWLYRWDATAPEEGPEAGKGDWVYASGALAPFQGYTLLFDNHEETYLWLRGTLVYSDSKVFNLAYDARHENLAGTETMLANSYLAPIDVTTMTTTDFAGGDEDKMEATIYVFNSGTPNNWSDNEKEGKGNIGELPGQFLCMSINSAVYTGGITEISSMQAFSVYAKSTGATFNLDYERMVYNPLKNRVTGIAPMRAPSNKAAANDNAPDVMKIMVECEHGADKLFMLTREDFNAGFDNGWDARKMFGESFAPQLYAFTPDGNMSVNCVPDEEGAVLGFRKGSADNVYTISFTYNGEKMLYLNDTKEQLSTLINDDAEYTFVSETGDTEARFIISETPYNAPAVTTGFDGINAEQKAKVHKVLINDHIYIIRGGRMYDATGKMLK